MTATQYAAVGLAVFFTIILALVNIAGKAKVNPRFVFSSQFCLYLMLFIIGNSAATLVATGLVENKEPIALEEPENPPPTQSSQERPTTYLPGPAWLWGAFFGVFGFHGVITRINITMYGQGVLTIEDWIAKAEALAVAAANESFTDFLNDEIHQTAALLAQLRTRTIIDGVFRWIIDGDAIGRVIGGGVVVAFGGRPSPNPPGIFRFWVTPAEASRRLRGGVSCSVERDWARRPAVNGPSGLPVQHSSRRSGCVPALPYPPLK